jgi:hypothetical protein
MQWALFWAGNMISQVPRVIALASLEIKCLKKKVSPLSILAGDRQHVVVWLGMAHMVTNTYNTSQHHTHFLLTWGGPRMILYVT